MHRLLNQICFKRRKIIQGLRMNYRIANNLTQSRNSRFYVIQGVFEIFLCCNQIVYHRSAVKSNDQTHKKMNFQAHFYLYLLIKQFFPISINTQFKRFNKRMVKKKREDYVKNVEVDLNKKRITRCKKVETALIDSIEQSEESLKSPKQKKMHHMTLKALLKKKNPPSSTSAQTGNKRKYIRKNYGKIIPEENKSQKKILLGEKQHFQTKGQNIEIKIKQNLIKNIEEVPSVPKRKGRKRKVVLQILKQTTPIKTSITQSKNFENYQKYFQSIMSFQNKIDRCLIFNREDPNYCEFVKSLNL